MSANVMQRTLQWRVNESRVWKILGGKTAKMQNLKEDKEHSESCISIMIGRKQGKVLDFYCELLIC